MSMPQSMLAEITLKPSDAAKALEYLLNAKQPVVLWGEPGVGKSSIVQQTAARLSLACQDVRAVLLDPVDLRGLPHVNGDGRSHWATPEFLPRDGNGVLFLDELNRAAPLVQNGCFQLVLDRKLGEYTLPDGWRIVSACNRESDGGGVSRMPSALCNRFVHINVVPDLEDWCKWAVNAGIEPVVIAFLRWKSELLHKFDRNTRAFPSPRSWSFVSGITAQKPSTAIELALVAGAVGHAAAIEYMAFLRLYRSLPSIDAILLNPTGTPVPTETSTLYAVASALARRANASTLGRVITYLDRLPVEFNVMAIRDAITRDATLTSAPETTKWMVKHSEIVF
jgi:AAA domain (dynein-related subfamily)